MLYWNWPRGSEEEDFKIFSIYIRYFTIISPWKRLWPFNWINLNPLYQRWLCTKFNWKCSSDSGEDFWIPSMYFRLLCNFLSPWKRVGPFIWTNLNSLQPRILCSKFGSSEQKMIPHNKSTDCIFVKTYHRLCLCKNKSQISFMSK